ncbi:MAG TPA: ABC transporter substrate-binding protein [Mycobacteriales bacterium]|jgi:NitT/TauT family transport system substrate-binding protein|nr:ABC transporter substrate-binding protein [Mycobacteriales bacterium]
MRVTAAGRFAAAGVLACAVLAGCSGSSGSGQSGKGLLGAAQCAANRSAGTITYVSPFGFDASAGIIEVFAADKLGYFKDLCLSVHIVTSAPNSAASVSNGTATTTSTGSAADFLVLASNGSHVTAVATYGNTSDYCIITRPEFSTLKQLEGHTLGYHFVQEAPDLEMLRAAGVDLKKVKLVNTPSFDPNQIVQGKLDSVGCYQSNEPLTLRAEHAKFHEFTPSQFGVSGTYNVVFFNTGFLTAHRDTAQDFMRADLHAFDYCEAHESACIKIEQGYASAVGADFDVAHESQVWHLEAALSKQHTLPGKGIGVQSYAEWHPEANEVRQFGLAPSVPALAKVEDTALVASLYRGDRLTWP